MVADKNIGGLQLYDSEGLSSSFMRAFSVGLIPRFMMLDAEGKIITARAPRPSSEEVRKFISYLSGYQKDPTNPRLKGVTPFNLTNFKNSIASSSFSPLAFLIAFKDVFKKIFVFTPGISKGY